MANEPLLGLLSGEEIKSEGLVIEALEAGYRASTYDLSIGEIIPGGREPAVLQPGVLAVYFDEEWSYPERFESIYQQQAGEFDFFGRIPLDEAFVSPIRRIA